MTFTQVQKKPYAASAAAVTHNMPTLDSEPVEGNLLSWAISCSTTLVTPSGWTLRVGVADAFTDQAIFDRRAAAGMGTSLSFDLGSSGTAVAEFFEYSSDVGAIVPDQTGSTTTDNGGSGTTGTTAVNDELAIAAVGDESTGSQGGTTATNFSAWSNSFTEEADLGGTAGAGDNAFMGVASRILTATGTYSTTPTGSSNSGMIATYMEVVGPYPHAVGTVATATSGASNPITAAPAWPTGYTPTADDLAVCVAVSKHDTEATPTIDQGFSNPEGSASGGGGTFGAGTGPARLTYFTKTLAGGDTAPTVSLAGTNTGRTLQAVIFIIKSEAVGATFSLATAFGAETTAGTGWSQATSSDPGITNEDLLLVGYGVRDDQHAGFSAMGITATSATISAVTERADAVTSQGNDQGIAVGSAKVTAGTGTAAPVITGTIGSSESGEVGVLRIREVSGNATVTPAVIACTTTLPQAAVSVAAAPAVIAATAALPAAAVGVGATPAQIAATAALPQPAVSVGAAPAVLAAVAALPLVTSAGQGGTDATVTPDAIAALAALPQAAIGVGASPAHIAAGAALPQAAISIGVTPAVLAAAVAVLQPGIGVGAAPNAIAALAALPQAAVGVGAAPAVLAATAALPAAAVGVGVAPAVLAAVAALPQPTSVGEDSSNATVSPAVIAAVVAVPAAALSVGAAPAVIPATVALPQSGVGVGVAPAVIPLAAALPQPQVFSDALVTPAAIALLVALPAPLVAVGVTPAVIVVVVALPQPARVGPPAELNINPAGPTMVGLVVVEADVVVGATSLPGGMVGSIG